MKAHPKASPATKAAVLNNGLAHAAECKKFKIIFGLHLDNFWGRPGMDFDGVMRQQPNNAQGFDVVTFVQRLGLRVSLEQPAKALQTRLLSLVGSKWGPDGVGVISRLLRPKARVKSQMTEKAGTGGE